MKIVIFFVVSFLLLWGAYILVGGWLSRLFGLDPSRKTPAHAMRDGLDYEPARASYLLPQHFSAIAAAGPIVGPILAALYFGWGPAWLWIIFGSILIGGIHDFTALVASIRHRGRSIAEVVRSYMTPRAYILFLIFVWCALVYVIIAFTDVTAGTFVQAASKEGAEAPGPAVATSSSIYLLLAVLMGLVLRFTRIGPIAAKMIFLPLVGVAIAIGPHLPLDLSRLWPNANIQQIWGYILLAYCFVAALVPVWLLLQPRGELGGYFLYIVMIAGVTGAIVGAVQGDFTIQTPMFKGWSAALPAGGALPLVPMLFITVACGACSGFHSIVASGTTSKQLDRETDAKPVAYGGMLLEGFFACLSLVTVMVLAPGQTALSQTLLDGPGLWLRAEPGESVQQASGPGRQATLNDAPESRAARTPAIQPGQSLSIELIVKPLIRHRAHDGWFAVCSQSLGTPEMAPVSVEVGVRFSGLSGFRFFLPYAIIAIVTIVLIVFVLLSARGA